ncbi:NADPH-dependent FMN reductase [Polynucleobacter sp. AP-Reno-20A-A9]|uniref:NADPH-dependent FMN reductase n=1 Tax=Polynucleobacter sp. AP-Reno-20A-A9 TaxID=2576925 RepID=UPI001C0D2173|nr:NADPH-dependent FMN reductase [Polynucleobacter sp. AP-Reno-20A-A9]MBU3628590.1 NAD(P)H-dependent oxidoreductase [Polynucleobacter sp. AP-Reno-20A-A9]
MSNIKIAVIVGSLRKESFNRHLANAIIKIAPSSVSFKLVEIGDLPLYNQDEDDHQADAVKRMKTEIHQCDGVLFVTPEYNRSIPGVLKNALDHGSRPYGHNAWAKKPAAIIGISPSPVGTALAQQHLRGVLATLDMPTLCQPEMFLQMKEDFFDNTGAIGEASKKFIKSWLDRYIVWVTTNKGI